MNMLLCKVIIFNTAKYNLLQSSVFKVQFIIIIIIVFSGAVYDITAYVEYHPGGADEVMRGAGIDATDLFNEVHRWVNFQNMLKEFLVGYLVPNPASLPSKKTLCSSLKPISNTVNLPSKNTDIKSAVTSFGYDCYQTERCFTLIVYGKVPLSNKIRQCYYYGSVRGKAVKFCVNCMERQYLLNVEVHHGLRIWQIRNASLKFEIILHKEEEKLWLDEGHHLLDSKLVKENNRLLCFSVVCTENAFATHDTRLLTFKMEDGCHAFPPLGSHIFVKNPDSECLVDKRPYTIFRVIDDINFQLLVKQYENGIFSSYLGSIQLNQSMKILGFDQSIDMNMLLRNPSIVFLAAGTGITPFFRLLEEISHNSLFSNHNCHLLFYNKTQNDILVKTELEQLQRGSLNIQILHILSQEKCDGLNGHVCDLHLANFSNQSLYLNCGPKQFMECVRAVLLNKHVQESNIVNFKG